MATPFVQGRLREEYLSVDISTACAHCDRPIQLSLDSDLNYHVAEAGAAPILFEPHVDWSTFTAPNILDAY